MKYILCFVAVIGLMFASDFENMYGAAPGTPTQSPFFYPDSEWVQVNTCALPGGTPHMGLFFDKNDNTLWHVVNVTNAPAQIYNIDTTGTVISQFTTAGTAYCLGICRVGDTLFIGQFYTSEAVLVYTVTGTFIRQFSISGQRCRGVDYDPNTGYLWVWGSPSTNTIRLTIVDHNGSVQKSINISGGYWTFDGCIDWNYYPTRCWYGDQQGNTERYCAIDTSAGTGSVLAQFPHPGSNYPEGITYLNQGGQGFVWTDDANSGQAYKMRVHARVGVEEERSPRVAATFKVAPNPNRGAAVIFSIPHNNETTITVYNASGSKITTLKGKERIVWNTDNLAAGVYFCKMDNVSKNLVIVK